MSRVSLAVLLGCLGGTLLTAPPGAAQTHNLTVAVLVNPANASGFAEYQRYLERYLEHLQMPYEPINVDSIGSTVLLGDRQLIVAGHRGLNLSSAWQTAIVLSLIHI